MTAAGKYQLSMFVSGTGLIALFGLLLWGTPLGEPWVDASYDYLFRFGHRSSGSQVVLIMMDNQAYDDYDQAREQPWDRGLHAKFLQKLADDGCSEVVFDSFFRKAGDATNDAALAAAMRRLPQTVLMAKLAEVTHPDLEGVRPMLPAEIFLAAAHTNWGVSQLDPDLDAIVRKHWPFPSPGPYPSLPWTAARIAGAQPPLASGEHWLRYYGQHGPWTHLSYRQAMAEPAGYFRNRVVFIGNEPRTSSPDGEADKFNVPYTRWTGETVGGVEILITSFLNLLNREWLDRPAAGVELLILIATAAALGVLLGRMQRRMACLIFLAFAAVVSVGAITWSYYTNHWFPWLIISGGQVPCAIVCAIALPRLFRATGTAHETSAVAGTVPQLNQALAAASQPEPPKTSDYELVNPPFGQGAYGKVWLVRNSIGQWQALKAVYAAKFGEDLAPYEREFSGIKSYKPVSDKHPGLLRVDFVSRKGADYFYYVMELGDALEPGWEADPSKYKPRDLASERDRAPGKRLPVRDCLRIGIELTEALDFLHQNGLTHRDIKPQNIIFVNGRPKLADVGLIKGTQRTDKERTLVGTPGYMPPSPERPGTPQADIYALGMVLYVLGTGRNSAFFPEIATTLVESQDPAAFLPLNSVILKACHPECGQRYTSAMDMHAALLRARDELDKL